MHARLFRWPIFLLAIATALVAGAHLVSTWHNPRPLVLPIPLQPDQVRSSLFQVDQALPYLVELEVDRHLPFERLQCLLGEQPANRDCGGVTSVVDIDWHVLAADSVVATGSSAINQGAGYGPTIEKTLGSFDAKPELEYTLQLRIRNSMEELRITNPRVVIQLHPIHTKGNYVLSALLELAALPFLVLGAVWFAIVGYRSLKSRKAV